ncbi:MAG: heme-binding protein [Gammaproteobacteria bacterium]|nr:heme-binding protein [Gammaproteobacteria bacterium]
MGTHKRNLLVGFLASISVLTTANAETLLIRSEKNISLELASEMATAAAAACREKGYAVTVTVVDRAGQIKTVLRGDGTGPHTLDSSRRKAYTSATTRRSTVAGLERIQKDPSLQYLPMLEGVLYLGGGVPIQTGNDVIGAIGVAGSPAGDVDDQCATAALSKFADKLK